MTDEECPYLDLSSYLKPIPSGELGVIHRNKGVLCTVLNVKKD